MSIRIETRKFGLPREGAALMEEDSEMWNIDDDVRWIDDGTPTTTMRLLVDSMQVCLNGLCSIVT